MPGVAGRSSMRSGRRARVAAIAALALTGALAEGASAAPPGFQAEEAGHRSKDARQGQTAPTQRQRDLAGKGGINARFNRLGTPSVVTTREGALERGLPSAPEAAARAYLRANRELFGLSPGALDDLQLVSVAPIGEGGRGGRWTEFDAPGFTDLVRVRGVAIPTPADGVRAAFQVVLVDE